MTHLTHDDLVAWRDNPDTKDRAAIVSHLAECEECAATFAALSRGDPTTELVVVDADTPLYFKPVDTEPNGYTQREDPRTAANPFGVFAWKAWASFAGVAVIVWGLFALVPTPTNRQGDSGRPPTLEISARADMPTAQTEIEWHSGAAATQYQVMLKDETGALVFGVVTSASRAGLPSEIIDRLQHGRTYIWTVTALDPNAEAVTSATKKFVYEAR